MTNTPRAWILFRSGSRLNLLDPSPNGWTDADLATGLSRTYRWGGQSCWNLPLSVAQHCGGAGRLDRFRGRIS